VYLWQVIKGFDKSGFLWVFKLLVTWLNPILQPFKELLCIIHTIDPKMKLERVFNVARNI
jgi:uncharacterized protein YggT (Ycf19 family)